MSIDMGYFMPEKHGDLQELQKSPEEEIRENKTVLVSVSFEAMDQNRIFACSSVDDIEYFKKFDSITWYENNKRKMP
jgi:hypothetical protein